MSKFGWKPQLPDFRDKRFHEHVAVNTEPPASIDLRKAVSAYPDCYDQGQLGSCTANAIAFLCQYDRVSEATADENTPSRLFIYFNERRMEGTVHSDAGANIRDGIKSLNTWGFCDEAAWPYHIGAFAHRPSQQAYTLARKEIVQDYLAVSQTLAAMKEALAAGFPIVIGFTVYTSFMSDDVANTGIAPMPQPEDQVEGGHAVAIVGYDDASGRFLVRNSWGTGWGMNGHFTIPYEYFTDANLASDLWVVRMVP